MIFKALLISTLIGQCHCTRLKIETDPLFTYIKAASFSLKSFSPLMIEKKSSTFAYVAMPLPVHLPLVTSRFATPTNRK